jgi:hypothetical protein
MTKYLNYGVQFLEFPDLRVAPGAEFEYELEPAREKLLPIRRVVEVEVDERPKKGGR